MDRKLGRLAAWSVSIPVMAAAIAGCTTTPVKIADAASVPDNRVYAKEYTEASPGAVPISLIRDSGFSGGGCISAVYLDGKQVAAIDKSEKLVLMLKPGSYLIGSGPNPGGTGLCKVGAGSSKREIEVNVEAGKPLSYRLGLDGGGPFIERSSSL